MPDCDREHALRRHRLGSFLSRSSTKAVEGRPDQNPLTSLPGNRAIAEFMQAAVRDGDATRHFCYCDFDNFKPFNDAYGFHLGDHAISLFASLMHRYFFAYQHFLGHVGADAFFIVLTGSTACELRGLVDRLLEDFHAGVFALYSEEDRVAGRMKGHDRSGAEVFFPLMRCSIGVLELPRGLVIDDISRVGAAIAGIKAKAKEDNSGVVFHPIGDAH